MFLIVPNSIAWQCYHDIVYIFNDVMHTSYVLESVACKIWMSLIQGHSIDSTISSIHSLFPSVSLSTIETDVHDFVDSLTQQGIAEVHYEN